MYICLNNTKNTKNIIESIKAFGLPVKVSEHSALTFLEVETQKDIISAYVTFYARCLRIYNRDDHANSFEIPFEELDCIYEL